MRVSGTPPAALAAMALKGRNASGAAPEKGLRGVCRPAGEDMFNILRKGRENGLRADRRNIIQSVT